MKIEKIKKDEELYRVRKMYKGKRYTVYFDHLPDDREVFNAITEKMNEGGYGANRGCFREYANDYIEKKRNVLSPSTAGGYQKVIRAISPKFLSLRFYEIELQDIQAEVNRYAQGRAPKSVKNFSGFISAVFKLYRPRFNYNVKLPQKKKYKGYVPTEEDVKRILEASKGSHYHIGFQLAVLAMRRSEICAATIDDLHGNLLTINKDRIYDENNHLMIRDNTKTEESTREIYLPDSLVEEIREAGYIYDRTPPMLVKTLHKYQDELEIPRFRLHDLRVFFVSYAHSLKIPDLYIQKAGGWKSDFVMKNTYLKELKDKTQEAQQNIASNLFEKTDR